MRRTALAAAAALSFVPALALAGPTAGISLGSTESQTAATNGNAASSTLGLFVRARLVRSLSLQGEIGKLDTSSGIGGTLRTYNAALVVDLAHGAFVPLLLVAGGADVGSADSQFSAANGTYTHVETGVGAELRLGGGFVLGADLRVGSRSDNQSPPPTPIGIAGTTIRAYTPGPLDAGQYRSARVTLGVRF